MIAVDDLIKKYDDNEKIKPNQYAQESKKVN
jgi:hypothetical protein